MWKLQRDMPTQRFFAAMEPQLFAAQMFLVNATSLRWRRARRTRKLMLVSLTQFFFAAMELQWLAV